MGGLFFFYFNLLTFYCNSTLVFIPVETVMSNKPVTSDPNPNLVKKVGVTKVGFKAYSLFTTVTFAFCFLLSTFYFLYTAITVSQVISVTERRSPSNV